MISPEHFMIRSQYLQEADHDAGQFYWGHAEAWLKAQTLFGEASAPVLLPRYRVKDIDNPEDWMRAEAMFKALQDLEQ